MEINTSVEPKKKFKVFDETFPLCAFSLAIAFLYPNRTNVIKRAVTITLVITINGGQLFWFCTYTFNSLYALDIYNFSRNMTLLTILVLFFIKTYYVISATHKFAPLLFKISKDLLKANDVTEDYQKIVEEHIGFGKTAQYFWLCLPVILSAQFPIYAGISMSIESVKTDDYTRIMVHDMEMIYVRDIQSEWPFFHLYFAYNCLQCIVLSPNYCGFDGAFCISTCHLRMKLKLMTHKLHRAFHDAKSPSQLKKLVNDAIKDHQDALEFYTQMQDCFGPWLFSVFMLSSFMISFNLYQIFLIKKLEPKYTIFGMFGVLHIFWPCHYASTLAEVSDDIAVKIYEVSWEKSKDPEITKMLVFMIARAQKTLILTGWIVVFNMDLFKSILQTSYSFFTLITA